MYIFGMMKNWFVLISLRNKTWSPWVNIFLSIVIYNKYSKVSCPHSAGFEKKSLQLLILSEHSILLFVGIVIGIVSALLVTLPALMRPGSNIPYPTIILSLCIVTANGIIWTYSATSMAIRKDLIPALRNE